MIFIFLTIFTVFPMHSLAQNFLSRHQFFCRKWLSSCSATGPSKSHFNFIFIFCSLSQSVNSTVWQWEIKARIIIASCIQHKKIIASNKFFKRNLFLNLWKKFQLWIKMRHKVLWSVHSSHFSFFDHASPVSFCYEWMNEWMNGWKKDLLACSSNFTI